MSDTKNQWTAEERAAIHASSPEYDGMSPSEIETLVNRYGTSMFSELSAGKPTPAALAQRIEDEAGAKAEAFYSRLRASEAAVLKRNAE